MANKKTTTKIGKYINTSGAANVIEKFTAAAAMEDVKQAQCLYIKNKLDGNVLFLSPQHCRLMDGKEFDALVASSDIVTINYTELYQKYGSSIGMRNNEICNACYWNSDVSPYIAMIKIFYKQALYVNTENYETNTFQGSTYDQYRKVIIPGTTKNLLQEFFLNIETCDPVKNNTNNWYSDRYDDMYFSDNENDYHDVEFGSLFALTKFKFHKKGPAVEYELSNEMSSHCDESGSYYYSRATFGGYNANSYNILITSTGGLFNILHEDFEDKFPDFAKKIKLHAKLFDKYTQLRSTLMNRENAGKAFLFTVRYQNKHALCISEIYDFDLIKRTFDYSASSDESGDEILKLAKVLSDQSFIKLKSRWGAGVVYLNKAAFTDKNTNIEISMSGDSYGVQLNFKSGRHKCAIPVTNDVLNELEGSIPEEQLTMLKCELVLRQ